MAMIVERELKFVGKDGSSPFCEVVTINWTSDSSGNVSESIYLAGFALKAITKPGSAAPTDNYDISLGDPLDSALDALDGSLADRDAANTEQKVLKLTDGVSPVFLAGDYTFKVANAGNTKTGTCVFYLVD